MSTRGWYDYYIIAPHTGTLSLAMRFYKWGDATPENALDEYLLFRETLDVHDGRLPVEWLDRLLRDQLGELHPELPPQFATGAFLFLLQRAAEWIECDSWRRFDPPEEREDLPLCYACVFRANCTAVPAQTGHRFRRKLDGCSRSNWTVGAKRRAGGDAVYSVRGSSVNVQ